MDSHFGVVSLSFCRVSKLRSWHVIQSERVDSKPYIMHLVCARACVVRALMRIRVSFKHTLGASPAWDAPPALPYVDV